MGSNLLETPISSKLFQCLVDIACHCIPPTGKSAEYYAFSYFISGDEYGEAGKAFQIDIFKDLEVFEPDAFNLRIEVVSQSKGF